MSNAETTTTTDPDMENMSAAYWGDLVTSSGGPSPMLTRLFLAYTDFIRTTDPTLLPPFEETNGKTVFPPDMVQAVFERLQINTILMPPLDLSDNVRFRCFKGTFIMLDVDYIAPAYITRKGFHALLLRFLRIAPDHLYEELNALLNSETVLIDPITESPFIWKKIPRRCFPEKGDEQGMRRLLELTEEAGKHVANIVIEERAAMARAREFDSHRNMQEEQTLADLDLRLARQEYANAMGREYIDEYGVRRVIPGAMNNMNAGNW
jgi:hypothetical protein